MPRHGVLRTIKKRIRTYKFTKCPRKSSSTLGTPVTITVLDGSKAILEDRLGIPVAHFSYPHGLFDDRCRKLVSAAGYQSACADIRGGNRAGTDPYQLRRSLMTCHETAWSFAFKLRTGFGMREWLALEMGELRGRPAPALLGGTS